MDQRHIEKLDSCSYENFISAIVKTIRKDGSFDLALASKIMNKSSLKNKYQMPEIDSLIQLISQNLCENTEQKDSFLTTIDLKYAYSQHNLLLETARHCNFNILSGDMTGTYCFKTGFYALTDILA